MTPETEDQIILRMIENVDPADTATLDEIDARVWCFNNNLTFDCFALGSVGHEVGKNCVKSKEYLHVWPLCTFYTRSRDALKAVRPDGWKHWALFDGYREGTKFRGEMFAPDQIYPDIIIQTDWLPTEELAELHATIQAIAYERTK